MKIIVRGILQKMLKYWTIRRRNDHPSNPAIQRIILEIFDQKHQQACQVCLLNKGH